MVRAASFLAGTNPGKWGPAGISAGPVEMPGRLCRVGGMHKSAGGPAGGRDVDRRILTIREAEFAAIDFESAGAAPGDTDTPVQVGIARMRNLDIPPEGQFVSYIDPGRPIAWAAARVHGIRREDVAGAPTLTGLWPDLEVRLRGRILVSHGAGTEKRFLRAFPLHGFGPWVDTVRWSRRLWPGLPDYSLEALIVAAGLDGTVRTLCPGRRYHDALMDSVAALVLLRWLVMHAGMEDLPAATLTDEDAGG